MISPEAGEVRELVREWYVASMGGRLGAGPFSAFITVWIALNALYSLRFDDIEGDRDQIRAFARWDRAVKEHKKLLEISDYPEAIRILAERGVFNFRRGRMVEIRDRDDLGQILEAVYQVRCNLFHGRKSSENMRDQDLAEASRLIVYRFVGVLLDDDSAWDDLG
jgi:hypothetical protein